MFTIFFIGSVILLASILIFKVIFFILSVLLAGAGFLIKTLVVAVLAIPAIPLFLLIGGSVISVSSLFLILASASLISYITINDKRYN